MADMSELQSVAEQVVQILGGPTQASRTLTEMAGEEVTRDAVQKWLVRGVAPKRVRLVAKATGIPTHQLRPDYYDQIE